MDLTRPKVSVIVATYNQEKYIARTLDSILAQRCNFPYEIVLSDDCSQDNTVKICQEYANRYPEIIRFNSNEENRGLVDNYFDAIRSAQGIYIADCGGDDMWCDPLKLQKQADLLDANPYVVLVHTDWKYYHENSGLLSDSDPTGQRKIWRQPILKGEAYLLPILTRSPNMLIHSCTMMIRKETFLRCDTPDFFSGRKWLCEDLQLFVALSRQGDIAYLPDVTMYYSVDKPSMTSIENPEKTYRFYTSALQLTRALQLRYNIEDKKIQDYYSRVWRYIFTQACTSGNKKMIREALQLRMSMKIRVPLRTRLKMFYYSKILS